ncbi:substrate-binding domain-containing protein [Nocardioides sp. BP30]|uniref:substrate-binding domain-containing protein n=1 Tax=Nocardioides sp. BP30 TaxID=3036374 RepID=UPI00246928E0|nr:substrate-binding domain-containing protein [Nocardioides sp. BP30]WGL53324.1 substrate-binding domain-containing protein [Nocardioides sp. BP30]
MLNRPLAALLTLALTALGVIGLGVSPSHADSYTPITGEGSSWAANAIDDWRARNANSYKVNFAATGSVAGLTGYANGSDDFAASDIPFGVKNTSPDVPGRAFAYLPDVAGGTALMYNLTVGGKRFTNLKLSGESIAGIFEGTIKMWNDPKIAADNPGVALPPLKITPVVRSDGSGSTAQFSLWMKDQYPSIWTCGEISFFTQCNKYDPTVHQAKSGDNGVAGFVAQAGNAGSIGYVEYSYALQSGYPVAKVLNKAGYYVLPTASNVAVALLKAKINTNASDPTNYLTQQLDDVYVDTDPRTYPISSYSYFVIPTRLQNGFTTDKGKTLSTFSYYALCQGQQQAPTLGYSPLPINLVQAGLQQIAKIPGAQVQNVNIKNCNNPTFSANGTNTLAKNALYPDLCDKRGAAATCVYGTPSNGKTSSSTAGQTDQNAVGAKSSGGGAGTGTSTTPVAGGNAGTGGGGTAATGTGVAATSGATGGTTGAGAATGGGQTTLTNPDGKTVCDPDTGQCTQLSATPLQLAASHSSIAKWAVWLMIAALGLLIFGPAITVLSTRRSRR